MRRDCFRNPPPPLSQAYTHSTHWPRHLGPWLEAALLLGDVLLGSGAGAEAARRPGRFWLRWSSWHWAPRGQTPLREKSGHSSVCFFLHCGGEEGSRVSRSRPLHQAGRPCLLSPPGPEGQRLPAGRLKPPGQSSLRPTHPCPLGDQKGPGLD